MGQTSLDIVRTVYEAWNREEFPGPTHLLDPKIEYVNPPGAMEPGTRHGLEAFARAVAKTFEVWETWQMEVEEMSAHGDDVAVVVRYHARGRGSGVEVDGRESALFTVRDGRVVRYAWYQGEDDAHNAMRELAGGGERVRAAIDAINRGDVDGFLARTHSDFEWQVLEESPLAGTYRGQEAVRGYVEEWSNTFDDVRLDIEELIEIGDQVLVDVRGSAWGKASGVEVKNHFCQLWTVSEGVPTGMCEYSTRDEALAAAEAA